MEKVHSGFLLFKPGRMMVYMDVSNWMFCTKIIFKQRKKVCGRMIISVSMIN